ncbi:MAG TPA: hypothetical protein PK079_13440 [Leptospiraceae bacterium]|nr:hypothetical protein [Leptospiraceae bacterium]HMW05304.1 hypothetical protein [Leptospiraceae bacterium]HMX34171.1 hypothetical protein [Leptospiraceae bacterium]HMY31500.1 hypothetical protein [Leptospiraceae bacterium]HNA06654.1 hypothetical protein [Leptospiraceae bacterium]
MITALLNIFSCTNFQRKGDSDLKRWYDYHLDKWNHHNSLEYNQWIQKVETGSNDLKGFSNNLEQYMTWEEANSFCKKYDMRLPSTQELISVMFSGVGDSWNGGNYWTSDSEGSSHAVVDKSIVVNYYEYGKMRVRCLPNLPDKSLIDLEPKAIDKKNWADLGDRNRISWYGAKLKCFGSEFRLPTRTELLAAHLAGLTRIWFLETKQKTSSHYWTSEEYSLGRAHLMHHQFHVNAQKWSPIKDPFKIIHWDGVTTFHAKFIRK